MVITKKKFFWKLIFVFCIEIPLRGDIAGSLPGVVQTVPTLPPLTFPPSEEDEIEEPAITKLPDIVTEPITVPVPVPTTTTVTPAPPPISPRIGPKPATTTPKPAPSCALPPYLKPHDDVAGPFYFGKLPNLIDLLKKKLN